MTKQPAEHERRHWHLEKTVSVGHIATTVAVAGSVFIWALQMDTRVAIVETRLAYTYRSAEKLETRNEDSFKRLEAALIRIEAKLDNKQDKR